MNWILSAFAGFSLGLASTLLTIRLQRSWSRKDDEVYNLKILDGLVFEIEEAIKRSKSLIEFFDEEEPILSNSRLYVALWESVLQRLARTLTDPDILKLLHRIYYRFDLINFNFGMNRPRASVDFARTHIGEVENNLTKLKEIIGTYKVNHSLLDIIQRKLVGLKKINI